MSGVFEIRLGAVIAYDGSRCTVVELVSDAVILKDSAQRLRRVRLVELLQDRAVFGGASIESRSVDVLALDWADATDEQREVARVRAGHLREMLTGYRSGNSAVALDHEPRADYDPAFHSQSARRRAKAAELGMSLKNIYRWEERFRDGEELNLLDRRATVWRPVLAGVDPRWVDTCKQVVEENLTGSKRSVKSTLAIVAARVGREFPGEQVPIPTRSTAYRAIEELTRGTGTFTASMKAKRSIANRPAAPYSGLRATRPGEYVLLDSTPLNVFGLAPITGRWMRADLTIAMDLYDRSILGLRLAPVSTKSIDVAGVLIEALTPQQIPEEWGERAVWPFHGVPSNVIVDAELVGRQRFRRPPVLPETIIIDHGKPYMSAHVSSVCQRLGISIQPAHVYTPTDKAPVERFFRTIEEVLQELPGYKGSDVAARGQGIEDETVYTIPQLEQIIREWIATVYHLRPHGGLQDPQLPGLRMSPAQKFEQGIAIAGRLRVPTDPDLLIQMLPVVKRKFTHYGVNIGGLRYNGDIVGKYHDRTRSDVEGKQTWPFFVNPDDLTCVYFHDPDDSTWHTLRWQHASGSTTPFSLDALEFAKSIALDPRAQTDVAEALDLLLERWGAGRASTPTERRISARLAAQLAETGQGPDSPFFPHIARRMAERAATSGLRDELRLTAPTADARAADTSAPTEPDEIDELDEVELMEDL